MRDKKPQPFVWVFRPRRSTEQLLEDLYQLVSSHGYAYELRVWEGNIVTGEAGWDVFLTSVDAKQRYAEIGLAYHLDVALQQAWENTPAIMDKLDNE